MNFREYVKKPYKFYLDMDGVICDFDAMAESLNPDIHKILENDRDEAWRIINNKGIDFWKNMPWTRDGKKLWEFLKPYAPTILSAHPRSEIDTCILGKKAWVKRELGKKIMEKAIICRRKNKQIHAMSNHILIDDQEKNIEEWEENGGIGILHVNTKETINKIKEILKNDTEQW